MYDTYWPWPLAEGCAPVGPGVYKDPVLHVPLTHMSANNQHRSPDGRIDLSMTPEAVFVYFLVVRSLRPYWVISANLYTSTIGGLKSYLKRIVSISDAIHPPRAHVLD